MSCSGCDVMLFSGLILVAHRVERVGSAAWRDLSVRWRARLHDVVAQ